MKGEGDIFATDSILNLLGASPHIPNAWDIIVHRVGSKLILDKREKSQIGLFKSFHLRINYYVIIGKKKKIFKSSMN